MSRGIFKKVGKEWKRVVAPSVKNDGNWTDVQKGFVKKDGVWRQFFPSDVTAKILVVGGGGGGGVGYGYEGGGGGGAGGVVYKENYTLSVLQGSAYNVVVGDGGGANGSGGYSAFGTGGFTTVNTSDVPIYAGTYPVYNGFLNTYGVWPNPDFQSPMGGGIATTVVYTTNIPRGQTYTLRVSADNSIRVWIGGEQVGSNDDWAYYNDSAVALSAGPLEITCYAYNWGGPALFAAALYDPQGNIVWDTRAPINYPTKVSDTGLTALGGGNGGWGTPEQTAGSGASGGGGCGYVNTHGGGAGYPGQGYDGGTGIWQGYGAAGGGGGGGFAGAGAGSNGNQGGAGGSGIKLLGFAVGGGGGGGYGNQGPGGDGPPGAGGEGGGGTGNGGDATPGTGGGGGGGLHGSQTSGGRGGSGLVVVQYPGIPLFTGGTIANNNGIVTHVFTSSGALTALG
jgi:hypothetical protein